MNRTGWLAVIALGAIGAGAVARWRWPSSEAALPCDAEAVRWRMERGVAVAFCPGPEEADAGVVLTAPALTLGRKLELNVASEADLALLPGVGPSLAAAIVRAREAAGGFRTWEEVDAVVGIGATKLETLRQYASLPGE